MKPERGFSIVEVLVALVLLQIVLLAIAPMFIYAVKSTAGSADLSSMGVIASRRMELLRGVPFDSLAAGGSLTADDTGFFDASSADFIERWRITDDATPPTMKTIEVRVVALGESFGVPDEVTLVNLAAQEPG